MSMRFSVVAVVVGTVFIVGCSQTSSPSSPSSSAPSSISGAASPSVSAVPNGGAVNLLSATGNPAAATLGGKPGYEPAYYNNTTVTINAIEVKQNAGPLAHAAADFYETVYPPDKSLWPDTPQCNPCDHTGDGIDFTDFHNHILDSIPSNPGHGEFNPLWHVFVILPADFSHAGQVAYAARLPMKSEAAVDAAIAAGVAVEVDTSFYFLCAVVNARAAK